MWPTRSFRRRLALALVVVLALAVVAPALRAQGGKAYENKDLGYRIKPPRDWTQIPLATDEHFQSAKWMSDHSYFYTEPGGWTYEHKPELVVIAFPKKAAHPDAPPTEDKEKGKAAKSVVVVVERVYKDYLDYLKSTNYEGGFYVSEQKELDLGDHKVTCYEIKIEKLASSGPKRIITWVHHAAAADFAVQVDVLETSLDKLKKEVLDAQKSFALIESAATGATSAGAGVKLEFVDDSELSPEERKSRRLASEKLAHDKAKATLTEGWQVLQVGRFMLLDHGDGKYARRVGDQAEAVFKWCETTFPFVGPFEYVRQPVIRVCANDDEIASFYSGSGAFFFGDRLSEIVTCDDQSGFQTSYRVDSVNRAVLELWFQERDRELWFALPGWLGSGLEQLVARSRVDKGKLVFRDDDWGHEELRELVRNGSAASPRDLLHMSVEAYEGGGGDTWAAHHYQSGALLRYLTIGAGARSAKTKDLMKNYIKALSEVVAEIRESEKGAEHAAEAKPKTEEEEEAYFRGKNQEWKTKEQQLLDRTFERCFRGWTDADWSAFDKAYFGSI